jgi:hypothetical protein
MISVETSNPVFSNVTGKTKEQKKENRGKVWEKTKNVYTKAKDSGILQGLENLALGNKNATSTDSGSADNYTPTTPSKEPMSTGMKVGIGVGILAIGFGIYWFGFRKK